MKKCIIRRKEKGENQFNIEHIFPESIGNKLLTTNSVCTACNSYLGRKIDNHLGNHKLIEMRRQMFRNPGKKGMIPNPLENGVLVNEDGRKVKTLIDKTNKLEVKFTPNIKEVQSGKDKVNISISLDKRDKKKLPDIVNKKLKRRGLPEIPREEIEKSIIYEYQKPTIKIPIKLDLLEYQKGILKIAYEITYYFIGNTYFNDEVGKQISTCLLDDSTPSPERYKINGKIEPLSDSHLSRIIKMVNNDIHTHLAFLNKVESNIHCIIKIYDVFAASIVVSKSAEVYSIPYENLVIINAKNGDVKKINFEEEICRYALEQDK